MPKKFRKILKWFLIFFSILVAGALIFFFVGEVPYSPLGIIRGEAPMAKNLAWGVTFSQPQAESLGLNWREAYKAILDDLGVRDLRLIAYWDKVEPQDGQYDFNDLDWQINEANARQAKIILAMGRKLPRWPECNEPDWAKNLSESEKQTRILGLLETIVLRYKNNQAISTWQIENEPFLEFGVCPKLDKKFLDKEISLVRRLDSTRPVMLTESGEFSLWFQVGKRADIIGSTLYRDVYYEPLKRFFYYPLPPIFYARKAALVKWLFPVKQVLISELQAEPWVINPPFSEANLDAQRKMMPIEKFRDNINFAKKTGLQEFYLWGVEWWYWMKETQNNPEFWNEARKLFRGY